MKQLRDKKIVISGIGIHDALGSSPNENFKNLITNNTNLINLKEHNDFKIARKNSKVICEHAYDYSPIDIDNVLKQYNLTDKDLRRLVNKTKFSINVIYQALKDSGINLDTVKNKNVPILFSPSYRNVEFTLSTDSIINSDTNQKLNPFIISNYRTDFVSDFISIRHSLNGPTCALSATCTTGLYNIDYAIKMLLTEDYDFIIVGAGNYMLTPHELFGFEQIGALNSKPNGLSSPFDISRSGFLLGQGAGCIILETEESVKKRNGKIYTEVCGIGLSVDGHHITSPDKSSNGAIIALDKCLETFNGNKIDYINAHATSTPIGDEIEAKLMEKYFPETCINSNKGHIGHCIVSSNILEIIYTILAMKHSLIPHTANLENPLEANLDFVMHKPKEKTIHYALKNSFGFGGRNGFILLKNMML